LQSFDAQETPAERLTGSATFKVTGDAILI
jgi:hypothetical protein